MGNPNPELHPENLKKPFQPGQSGNPGGKTSAQRKLEVENAEKATRIHGALLDQFIALIEGGSSLDLEANLLKLVKDAQDRGLGTPVNKAEIGGPDGGPIPFGRVERIVIDPAIADAKD
jgi:hypothetical protein